MDSTLAHNSAMVASSLYAYTANVTLSSPQTFPTLSPGAHETITATITGQGAWATTANFSFASSLPAGASIAVIHATIPYNSSLLESVIIYPAFILPSVSYVAAGVTATGHSLPATEATQPSYTASVSASQSASSPTTQTRSQASESASPSATSAAATSTPNPHVVSQKTLAGAAVGCLLAGLFIASLIAFLIMTRRRKTSKISHRGLRDASSSTDREGEALMMSAGGKKGWEKQLPQPDSDQTIAQLVNRTLDDIEGFVENFYRDQQVILSHHATAEVAHFNSPHLQRPLADLLQTASSPTVLIKHGLANCLLETVKFTQQEGPTLLPKGYNIPATGDQRMLSRVRVLISQSRSNSGGDDGFLNTRDQSIQDITQQIEQAFQPWAQGNAQDRAKNLKGMMIHLGEMGLKLFSQPAVFKWLWMQDQRLSSGQIVMLPGLNKVTDSHATDLVSPISLVSQRLGNYSA